MTRSLLAGRRRGHTVQALREDAMRYGLEIGVESKGDGAFRYTLEDATGKIHAAARGMKEAEKLLEGVGLGWRLGLEEGLGQEPGRLADGKA